MKQLFISYLLNSINITCFILLMLLIGRVLSKKFSAVCLYCIWVILLLGLLIPVRVEFINPLLDIKKPQFSSRIVPHEEIDQMFYEINHTPDLNTSDNAKVMVEKTLPERKESLHTSNDSSIEMFLSVIVYYILLNNKFYLLWVMGAVFIFIKNYTNYYKYQKLLKRFSYPLEHEDIMEEFEICKKEIEIKKRSWIKHLSPSNGKIGIRGCSIITSPVTIGIFHPMILFPQEAFTKEEIKFLLKHEFVHVYQKDSIIKLIRLIVMAINWFNPFCYILSRNIDKWCEAACDEIVLEKALKTECYQYGRLVIRCAEAASHKVPLLLINFYGGKNNMKQRLLIIINQNKKRSGKFLLVFILFMVSTTILLSMDHQNALATNGADVENVSENGSVEIPEDNNSFMVDNSSTDLQPKTEDNITKEKDIDDIQPNLGENDSEAVRDLLVEYAIQAESAPYEWGGNDLSTGVDCSGFVQAVYKKFGYELPRTSREQLSESKEIAIEELLPGDLVFYENSYDVEGSKINHVAIYIGNNRVIHATNHRDGVRIADINYRTPYCGGRYLSE